VKEKTFNPLTGITNKKFNEIVNENLADSDKKRKKFIRKATKQAIYVVTEILKRSKNEN